MRHNEKASVVCIMYGNDPADYGVRQHTGIDNEGRILSSECTETGSSRGSTYGEA